MKYENSIYLFYICKTFFIERIIFEIVIMWFTHLFVNIDT